MKCCIAGCGERAATILIGLALCDSHVGDAEDHPELQPDFGDITPGRLYDYLFTLDVARDDVVARAQLAQGDGEVMAKMVDLANQPAGWEGDPDGD